VSLDFEPRAAQLPLSGGQPGAAVTVRPLLVGEIRGPEGWFLAPQGRFGALRVLATPKGRQRWYPVPAFLVEHPGAGPFLIDTGLHESVATAPAQNMGGLFGRFLYDFRFDSDQALVNALPRLGVAPRDIGLVVMTHLHLDHASAVVDFPDATFVVAQSEWSAAAAPRGELKGYIRRQFDHAFDWRTIDFDDPALDSFATFGRSVDLFGDGSVRLLYTPGHTLGHVSVLLRLDGREVLVAADAAYDIRTIRDGTLPLLMADSHLFRRSLGELQQFVSQSPDLVVIPGHDPDTWMTLDPLYR
jgi:glyoxylase-like metal-dependent hydrolase (beta-lactamase superfamily II)